MSEGTTILDDLRTVFAWYHSLPPVLTAIWFVDRMHAYHAYRARYGFPEHRDIWAIPAHEWYARYATTDEDWKRAPAFCGIPGVWLQMSDGAARPLDDTAIAALLAGTLGLHPQRETATPA